MTKKFYSPELVVGLPTRLKNVEIASCSPHSQPGLTKCGLDLQRYLLNSHALLQVGEPNWLDFPVDPITTGPESLCGPVGKYVLEAGSTMASVLDWLSDTLAGPNILYTTVNTDDSFTVYKCCRFGGMGSEGQWQLPGDDDPAVKDKQFVALREDGPSLGVALHAFETTGDIDDSNHKTYVDAYLKQRRETIYTQDVDGTMQDFRRYSEELKTSLPNYSQPPLLLGKILCHWSAKGYRHAMSAYWTQRDVEAYRYMYTGHKYGPYFRWSMPDNARLAYSAITPNRADIQRKYENETLEKHHSGWSNKPPYILFREDEEVTAEDITSFKERHGFELGD